MVGLQPFFIEVEPVTEEVGYITVVHNDRRIAAREKGTLVSTGFHQKLARQSKARGLEFDAVCEAISDEVGKTLHEIANREIEFTTADQFPAMSVNWLMSGFFGQGFNTMIAAMGGMGKSTFCAQMAANATAGRPILHGANPMPPTNVLWLSYEEHQNIVITPRHEVLGGDPSKLIVLDKENHFSFDGGGFNSLKGLFKKYNHNIGFIFVDTLYSFYPDKHDSNNTQHTKKLLDAFNQLTEGENCIGVPMVHISTKKNTPLEANVLGSSQLTNSTRIVARVEEDPEDTEKKGLYVVKSNVGPQRSGQLPIGFRIKTLGENLPYAGIEHDPEPPTWQRVANGLKPQDESKEAQAIAWLQEMLPAPVKELKKKVAFNQQPFSWPTVERAAATLGVVATPIGPGRGGRGNEILWAQSLADVQSTRY